MSALMIVVLDLNHFNEGYDKPFLAATHLILAILAGCGLMLIGAFCAKPTAEKLED
jgi:hypothetical protein